MSSRNHPCPRELSHGLASLREKNTSSSVLYNERHGDSHSCVHGYSISERGKSARVKAVASRAREEPFHRLLSAGSE